MPQPSAERIKDKNGHLLPFSSVFVKGTTRALLRTAKESIRCSLIRGEYTLLCQFIGYKTVEKKINGGGDESLDFELGRTAIQFKRRGSEKRW
jgi:hypothetical protein